MLSITDQNGNAITSETHIGNLNPFRYRGYYYDTESGFYYLMSRYYDPVTHRFINADGCFQAGGDILDANMSVYCANNPITRADNGGKVWNVVIGATVGALISGGLELVSQIMSGKNLAEIDWISIGIETVTGAATGALGACGISPLTYCAVNGVVGAASSGLKSWHNGDSAIEIGNNAIIGGLTSFAISGIGEGVKSYGSKLKSAKYMKLGRADTFIKNNAKSISDKISLAENTTNFIKNTTQKVHAPAVKRQPQQCCRGCGRPIGNQYPWQCSSPTYY